MPLNLHPDLIKGLYAQFGNEVTTALLNPPMTADGKKGKICNTGEHANAIRTLLSAFYPKQKNIYLSPYDHQAVSACVVYTYNDMILIGLRGKTDEKSGKHSLVGGFRKPLRDNRDISVKETAVRETQEEAGLIINPDRLNLLGDWCELRTYMAEMDAMDHVNLGYQCELTADEVHQVLSMPSDSSTEMSYFKLVDKNGFKNILKPKKMAFADQIHWINKVFSEM